MFNPKESNNPINQMLGRGPNPMESINDANQLKSEIIFKIADLKTDFRIKINEILASCEDCRTNQAKKYKEYVDRKNDILDNYDFANQWFLGSFLIGPKPQMQKIVGEMDNVRKGLGFPYCEKHMVEDVPKLKNLEVEIESLIETLDLIK